MNEPKHTGNPPPQKDPPAASGVSPVPAEIQPVPNEPLAPLNITPAVVKHKLAVPRIRLERKHPLAIRWMHWINFPVLFTMIWSGMLIYWNVSDNAYQHPHAIYRLGVGPFTLLRMFPDWFYTNRFWDMRYHVTEGLGYHFFFMWLF